MKDRHMTPESVLCVAGCLEPCDICILVTEEEMNNQKEKDEL